MHEKIFVFKIYNLAKKLFYFVCEKLPSRCGTLTVSENKEMLSEASLLIPTSPSASMVSTIVRLLVYIYSTILTLAYK